MRYPRRSCRARGDVDAGALALILVSSPHAWRSHERRRRASTTSRGDRRRSRNSRLDRASTCRRRGARSATASRRRPTSACIGSIERWSRLRDSLGATRHRHRHHRDPAQRRSTRRRRVRLATTEVATDRGAIGSSTVHRTAAGDETVVATRSTSADWPTSWSMAASPAPCARRPRSHRVRSRVSAHGANLQRSRRDRMLV